MAMAPGRTTVELIRESALGDEQAIPELVQETAPDSLAFVAKGSQCDPENLVDEVLAKAYAEKVTIDMHGNHTGYDELGEKLGLGSPPGCSTSVQIANTSTQVFVRQHLLTRP